MTEREAVVVHRAVSRSSRPALPLVSAVSVASVLLAGLSGCAGPADSDDRGSRSPGPSATETAGPGDPSLPAGAPSSDPAAVGGQWTLVAMTDARGTTRRPLPAPTLDLREPGTMSGEGGCNAYSSAYSLADGRLSIGPVVVTTRECVRRSAIESRYLAALERVTAARGRPGMRLELTGDDVALVFEPDPRRTVMTPGPSSPSSAGPRDD